MISYDFYCKFETTATFLKSPFNLSSANSQFLFRKREMKKWKCAQWNLCKQYEHNNSHWKFILDKTIFVWLSWFEINWLFCFCCFFVPKIYVRIGMEQELERVAAVKNFCMAPPAMWVLVYSLGCPVAQGEISRFGQP